MPEEMTSSGHTEQVGAAQHAARLHEARVVSLRPLSPSVIRVGMQGPPDYTWQPGQHLVVQSEVAEVGITAPAEPANRKKYFSIASAPRADEPGWFELAVGGSKEDRGWFRPDSRFFVSAPSGRAAIHPQAVPSRVAMVAMGTGVAPLRAVIQQLKDRDHVPNMVLLHGCRTSADLLFADEFRKLQSSGKLDYRPVLSRPDSDWQGLRGRVQEHVDGIAHLDSQFCVCGSNGMVVDVVALLAQRGIAGGQVFAEGYA